MPGRISGGEALALLDDMDGCAAQRALLERYIAQQGEEEAALNKALDGFFDWLDEQEAKSSAEAGRAFRRAFADLQRRLRGAIHRKLRP